MENGKIKCNLCNKEYSADACKSFTYGRLDVNICPTCLSSLVKSRMGSYGEKNAATKERQALTWKRYLWVR